MQDARKKVSLYALSAMERGVDVQRPERVEVRLVVDGGERVVCVVSLPIEGSDSVVVSLAPGVLVETMTAEQYERESAGLRVPS